MSRVPYWEKLSSDPSLPMNRKAVLTISDTDRIEWLRSHIVDTIYLDDGKIVDVRGGDLRKSIDEHMAKWPALLGRQQGGTE